MDENDKKMPESQPSMEREREEMRSDFDTAKKIVMERLGREPRDEQTMLTKDRDDWKQRALQGERIAETLRLNIRGMEEQRDKAQSDKVQLVNTLLNDNDELKSVIVQLREILDDTDCALIPQKWNDLTAPVDNKTLLERVRQARDSRRELAYQTQQMLLSNTTTIGRLEHEAKEFQAKIATLEELLAGARARCDKAESEAEQLRVQLAGCSVAALGGTSLVHVAKKGDFGWSVAYQDVLDLRLKYNALCERVEGGLVGSIAQEMAKTGGDTDDVLALLLRSIQQDWSDDPSLPGVLVSYLGRDGGWYASIVRFKQALGGGKYVVINRRGKTFEEAVRGLAADYLDGKGAKDALRKKLGR